jgi:carboxyl-terminal processing protease
LIVLVDRHTASVAELFAGALQAHGRAVVVGERTYGKGTAQKLLPGFSDPHACYATVATFTLPNGAPVEGRGICPDVEIAARASAQPPGEAPRPRKRPEARLTVTASPGTRGRGGRPRRR